MATDQSSNIYDISPFRVQTSDAFNLNRAFSFLYKSGLLLFKLLFSCYLLTQYNTFSEIELIRKILRQNSTTAHCWCKQRKIYLFFYCSAVYILYSVQYNINYITITLIVQFLEIKAGKKKKFPDDFLKFYYYYYFIYIFLYLFF